MSINVKLVMGYPASGKSTLAESFVKQGYARLNRDKEGGSVKDLLPKMNILLTDGKSVVLDNLYCTAESRREFIEMAKAHGVPIDCEWMTTGPEDSQINSLMRMYKNHGKILFTAEEMKEIKSPNTFPIVVIFRYKKEFEKPSTDEGFRKVNTTPFIRIPNPKHIGKAVFLDYDGTLRTVSGKYKYPVTPNDLQIKKGVSNKLKAMKKDGYLLLGVSNQSGVARGHLTDTQARKCFDSTNTQLGVDIEYMFCPHNVPPSCYCRKPQSGMGVHFICKYKLDPKLCVMVGDATTDKTFATRMGMQYFDEADFFKV